MILIRNLVLISVCCRLLPAQTVSTSQFNIQRTAATTNETTLTQSNVSNLHLQGSFAVDGAVYAQPLIIDGVNIGGATRVLIVATVWDGNATADGGSLYAFDADKPGTSPIWHVNLVTPPTTGDGCLATPVVDTGNAIVYAVCQDAAYRMWLYALNLADGSTYQAANQITCTYSGVTMMDHVEGVRTGLLLYGGQIYFGASAVLTGDEVTDGSRGWVFEYNAATLAQTNCMTVVPHLVSGIGGAGIWQAGVGFAVDSGGSIRFGTGNGVWNGPVGDYGESIMKLSANLSVLDYFTPADWATLNSGDTDQDAGGIMVAGSHLFQWGKSGILWVDPAGGLNGSGGSAAQSWDTGLSNGRYTSTVIGSMAFGNNVLYLSGSGPNAVGPIKAYTWNGSTFNTTPAAISANTYSRPGARLSYSSNGSIASTELLWAITAAGPVISYTVPGTLRVFNASTLSELWNSDSSSGNAMGFASKFVQPTIADGKIYAATSSKAVVVYGLLATPTVTFTGAPASAPYNSTFTVSSSTNASTTAVITASGACSISGNTVTMTSGTGTCTLTATWAADSNYSSATATQSTTASQIAPTATFTGAPASAPYNSTFTVSSSTNASTTAVITASGACSISGNRVTMTSGTGTCTLTATWAADSDYTSATATQSTTASKIAPTATFTGAPASAPYNSTFTVSSSTNASTTAVITASGACSISGNTVTMTSGTGTCTLTATWAADSNYSSATATQSTTASQIAPTATFTGAPASAPYNSTFTVSSSTNASTTAVITASGACSISGNRVTMTSGTGTCTLTATWAADSNYTSTTATQSTTASKIAPTVTFTGAPASAPDNSIFTVSSSTNASTTAVITASGACSISGNRVTMTSGTGTCTLTATWAADSNYTSATATQSTTASGSSSAPWPNGYSYQATFTVAAGQVPSAQTNFPALISGTFTDFATTANGGRISNTCTQTVGNNLTSVPCDLIFTSDAAGTMLLNWEFETWTPATGAVNLWVNVPNLSNGTVIYAWYGQPSVTTPQTTPSATWSSNFMAVYHLKENPAGAAPQMNDSTANANHATMNGAVQASQQQPGEIDGSVNFEGNTWASIANPANFSFERTDSFSLSGWFKLASNAVGTLFSKFPAVPSAGWLLLQQPSASDPTLGLWLFGSSQSSWAWGETPPVTMGAWHYVVATYSGTSTVAGMRIYVDGVNQLLAIRGNTLTSSMVNTLAPAINGRAGPNQMSTASMDELRVSTKGVVFSPAWVTASYNNQSKPGTFFTVVTGLTN